MGARCCVRAKPANPHTRNQYIPACRGTAARHTGRQMFPNLSLRPGAAIPGSVRCGELMDDLHFDALTRGLAAPDTRRRVLSGLAALPVLGGLFGILDADDAQAGGGRRKRRKKRHKHGKGRRRTNSRGKHKPKPPSVCVPDCTGKSCGDADGCGGTCTNGCAAGLVCADGRCIAAPGTCAAGAGACGTSGVFVACNAPARCQCQVTTEGQTACLRSLGLPGAGGSCGGCGDSAECGALFPDVPGVVCVAGPHCCGGASRGFCMAPCDAIFS